MHIFSSFYNICLGCFVRREIKTDPICLLIHGPGVFVHLLLLHAILKKKHYFSSEWCFLTMIQVGTIVHQIIVHTVPVRFCVILLRYFSCSRYLVINNIGEHSRVSPGDAADLERQEKHRRKIDKGSLSQFSCFIFSPSPCAQKPCGVQCHLRPVGNIPLS